MGIQAGRAAACLQPITQSCGNALALPVWMHIQPVQIAVPADIAKADDLILLLSHQRIVAEEGAVPCGQVGMPVRPGIQLLGSIVNSVGSVHRFVEQPGQFLAVQGAIFAQFQRGSPFRGNDTKRFPGARRSPRERFRAETVYLW